MEAKEPLTAFTYIATRDDDLRLVQWFMKMEEDGDLEGLLMADSRTPGALLRMMAPPKFMWFGLDPAGKINVAMWGEELMSAVFIGFWIAKEYRKSRSVFEWQLRRYEWLLTKTPAILGVTKQAKLLKPHERLGYTILGQVPGLFGGDDAWVVMLTRDGFAKALPRFRRVSHALEV